MLEISPVAERVVALHRFVSTICSCRTKVQSTQPSWSHWVACCKVLLLEEFENVGLVQ